MTSVSSVSVKEYAQQIQAEPMTQAQKMIIDRITAQAKSIMLDEPVRAGVRWKDTIIEIPELLATEAFLKEVHQHVQAVFKNAAMNTNHICISESGRTIEFHSDMRRPRISRGGPVFTGTPDRASSCKRRRLEAPI